MHECKALAAAAAPLLLDAYPHSIKLVFAKSSGAPFELFKPSRGVIENKPSTDVVFRRAELARSDKHSPWRYQIKSCSDLGW